MRNTYSQKMLSKIFYPISNTNWYFIGINTTYKTQ